MEREKQTRGAFGEGFSWEIKDGVLTICGSGEMPDWRSWLEKNEPKGLSPFANDESFHTLVIEDGITKIGAWTFPYATKLTRIIFPDSLTEIGEGAFYRAYDIQITLPNSVTKIGSYAFSHISAEKVVLPDGLTSIGPYAFYACSHLTSITIPNSVTSIGDFAFCYCRYLERAELPKDLTEIGEYAFYACEKLTGLHLSENVTRIGSGALSGIKTEQITISPKNPNYFAAGNCLIEKQTKTLIFGGGNSVIPADGSVTKIGMSAFARSDVTCLTVPNTVTEIESYAFTCSKLKTIVLPDGITEIRGYTFNGSALERIVIPAGVTKIGKFAFNCCGNLKEVSFPEGLRMIGNCAFGYCRELTSLTFPESLEDIHGYAFRDCSGLTELTFLGYPQLHLGPFCDCSAIESVRIKAEWRAQYRITDLGCTQDGIRFGFIDA